MNNKMKKSKYAALVLASTMALSTVVTAAPQAFDNNAITAHAASSAATEVKNQIAALKFGEADYDAALTAARTAYDALTEEADKKAVSNLKVLEAHEKVKNNTALKAAITAIPTEGNIEGITEYTLTGDVVDVDETKKDKKGKVIVRGINKDLEGYATKLETFNTEYTKASSDSNVKKVLANTYKSYKTLKKQVEAKQKYVNAVYYAKDFVDITKTLITGGSVTITSSEIKHSKGKFKIDGDQYLAVNKSGTIEVTDPHGDVVTLTDGVFEVDNKDATEGSSTLKDTYKVSLDKGLIKIEKIEESVTVPITSGYNLDSKMDMAAYKGLKAGSEKYKDEQIEAINKLAAVYKALDGTAKKTLTEEQVNLYKTLTADLKVQQSLEKKLASTNSAGVTTLISKLKYTGDVAAYNTAIQEARTTYNGLTAKYKKKVKVATVKSLVAHEAAYVIIKDISELPKEALASATSNAELDTLKTKIAAIDAKEGSYHKADKAVKSLVKNYKDIKAINKVIDTQETYYSKKSMLDDFEGKLTELTATSTVRIVDKMANLDKVYKITVDKQKVATFENGETKKEIVEGVTDTTSIAGYAITNNKGKLSISKTETGTAIPAISFKGVTLDTFTSDSALTDGVKYTTEQITKIEEAIDKYDVVNKDKVAKKFLNKEDITAIKKYQTALKGQQALQKKADAADVAKIKKAITELKYATDDLITTEGENKNKTQYEVDAAAALTLYKGYVGISEDNATGDADKVKALKDLKAKLDDHTAAATVATTINNLIAVDEVTQANAATVRTAAASARTAYNALTSSQKSLLKAADVKLKAIEKASNLSELPKADTATASLSGKVLTITLDQNVKVEAQNAQTLIAKVAANAENSVEEQAAITATIGAQTTGRTIKITLSNDITDAHTNSSGIAFDIIAPATTTTSEQIGVVTVKLKESKSFEVSIAAK